MTLFRSEDGSQSFKGASQRSGHRIAVIGTGYVGLTSGACLAHLGHFVTCMDSDAEKVRRIATGDLPIMEPGLPDLVSEGVSSERLHFTTNLSEAASNAEFVLLCLPTPQGDDGAADLSAVNLVIPPLAELLLPGSIVVLKSTVPVGSTNAISETLGRTDVKIVSNPEFLREGFAVRDFLNPDRIVIGSDCIESAGKVLGLYDGLSAPAVLTDPLSSETIKHMANAFLALKLSFVNQMARYCDAVGANVLSVASALGHDPRIGGAFLIPGPGWGGSCLPKDTRALTTSAQAVGSPMTLIEQAIVENAEHTKRILEVICDSAVGSGQQDPRVCLLGLTFKANTNDLRDSPAIRILADLQSRFENIVAYDPAISRSQFSEVDLANSIETALHEADVVVILTEWPQFRDIPASTYANSMRGRLIVDTRYILDPEEFFNLGLEVRSIGRPSL